jgi:hypothetical protein
MSRSNRWAGDGSSPGAYETARLQHQIGQVMGDVMMDARRRNPNMLDPATPRATVPVAPTVVSGPEPVATRGWRSEIDLRLPRARTLSALCVTQLCHTGLRPIRLRQSECKSRL